MSTKAKISNHLKAVDPKPPAARRWWMARGGWYVVASVAPLILILATPGYLASRPMGSLGNPLVFDRTPFMWTVHRLNLAVGFIPYGHTGDRKDGRLTLFRKK